MRAGSAATAERITLMKAILWRTKAASLRLLLLYNTTWEHLESKGDKVIPTGIEHGSHGSVTAQSLLWCKQEAELSPSELLRRHKVSLALSLTACFIHAVKKN